MKQALAEFKPIIKKTPELRMPNPSLSRIKCFPKIRKEGNAVSGIKATRNSPTQNIARCLLEQVKRFSLKVIARLNHARGIQNDEWLVSFHILYNTTSAAAVGNPLPQLLREVFLDQICRWHTSNHHVIINQGKKREWLSGNSIGRTKTSNSPWRSKWKSYTLFGFKNNP